MFGGNKAKSSKSISKANQKKLLAGTAKSELAERASTTGYGGHFRAVQGFKYLGNRGK